MLFISLSTASDLKSGPIFFSQLNVSPAKLKHWDYTCSKSFASLQASPFVAYHRSQMFVGKSKPAEVRALVNFVTKGQVTSWAFRHLTDLQAVYGKPGLEFWFLATDWACGGTHRDFPGSVIRDTSQKSALQNSGLSCCFEDNAVE